jgi:2-keto-4-pentenoate hydratase/2-oxohepta-3-ene-1,7-dioic acid hydratase in catechol pathway
MRFIRYQTPSQPPRYGWVHEDKVGALDGLPFGEFRRLEADLPLRSVTLLAPVEPGKIIGIGRNYIEHAREQSIPMPEIPQLFLKPPSTVIGPHAKILLPPQSQQIEHAASLVVVIGRVGRWIPLEKAMDYVLGFTIGNDISARDLQQRDGQWTRAKGFDTFCPLGPWIETELDPTDVMITCHVNSGMRQMASTRDMVFSIKQLVAFISSIMTLNPGDIIMTGTPTGTGQLMDGDVVQITVDGIGTLRNPVSAK